MEPTERPLATPETEPVGIDPELEICAQWIAEHGDPCDWCDATKTAYRNTIHHAALGVL